MKKLVLSLAFLGFVAFGVVSVQNLIAASSNIEMTNFDKDPKKDGDKKAAETKEVKATEANTAGADAKACPSTCADKSACTDKSASSKSCSDKEKAACCPDKK